MDTLPLKRDLTLADRTVRATKPGRRRTSAAMPTTLTTARIGTAALAVRGGSTSSKNGTGSPHSACSGPTGQSPRPPTSAAPSAIKKATLAQSGRFRLPVRAHTQM